MVMGVFLTKRKLFFNFICGLVAILFWSASTQLRAQSVNYAAEVLTIGAGARPLAMGGAFVAAANDATAAYWNPSGLALVDDVEITTMHAAQSDLQSYD